MSSSLSLDKSMNALIKRTMMEKILQQHNIPFTELEKEPGYTNNITDDEQHYIRIYSNERYVYRRKLQQWERKIL